MQTDAWYSDIMDTALERAYQACGYDEVTVELLEPSEVLLAWIGALLVDLLGQYNDGEEWKNEEGR